MEKVYPVFTVEAGRVHRGADVVPFELSNGTTIWATLVGERGRGRQLGVVPVTAPAPLGVGARPWRLEKAFIGRTMTGRPKLIWTNEKEQDKYAIIVFKTPIGYRGSNRHFVLDGVDETLLENYEGVQILAKGVIAQGEAGRMGSGDQYVAVVRRGIWIKTTYSGRLYGRPAGHIYRYNSDAKTVEVLAGDEWELGVVS